MAQPATGYIQVQPVVTAAPVNNYTSKCECNDLWCSFCWLSCFDLGCVGFLTNAMLYNRNGIRCGFMWIVLGLTITSILSFVWWILKIYRFNSAWIVYVIFCSLGFICLITKIV